MRFLLVLLLLPALAWTEQIHIDTRGLSPEQVQQIQNIANVGRAETTAKVIRSEVSAWGEMGANFGQALVAVAKEIGVAAADFASTPLGKLVLVLLVVKMFGGPILGTLLGLMVIALATWLWHRMTRTLSREVTFEVRPYLFGLWQRKVAVKSVRDSSEFSELAAAILIIGNIGGVVCIAVSAAHL